MEPAKCPVDGCGFVNKSVQKHRSLRNHIWQRHQLMYQAGQPPRKPHPNEFDAYKAKMLRGIMNGKQRAKLLKNGDRNAQICREAKLQEATQLEITKEKHREEIMPDKRKKLHSMEEQTKLKLRKEYMKPEKPVMDVETREKKLVHLVERYSELTDDLINWIKRAEKRNLNAKEDSIRERKRRLIETLNVYKLFIVNKDI